MEHEESDQESSDTETPSKGMDALVWAIDCSPSMRPHLSTTLHAIASLIAQDNSILVSILLYNVLSSRNAFNLKSIYSLGSCSDSKLSDLLWSTNPIFSNCQRKIGSKRLFLVTDNDNPHVGDVASRAAVMQRAKDLNDYQVEILVFGFPLHDKVFDFKNFYAVCECKEVRVLR